MPRNTRRRVSRAAGALVVLIAVSFAATAEEIVTVSGRKNETQSYLLMNYPRPKAVAVMFSGGEGLLRLRWEGESAKTDAGQNFLVRTRGLFRDTEVAVAIV